MRSIGAKNIALVKKTTLELLKNHTDFGQTDYSDVQNEVRAELPEEIWDTWESADAEINRIINDVMTAWSVRKG